MRLRIVVSFLMVLFFMGLMGQVQAQSQPEGKISGQIVDTISNNVSRATISLLKAADTANAKRTLSDSTGHFSFSNLELTTYIMRISFQGYDVADRYVSISKDDPVLNVGEITLQQTINELGTVVVTAIVPVTFKGDTTEFNADAFGTKPNATVEDLLKKLPGMEVGKDGSIQSQGEAVPRVFVDGKRFFGNDPKMATQNLPRDVVDKIQVFDGKSDQAEFTGFDDGNSIKTINIVTKKDRRHGMFGRYSAAIGNDDPEFKNGLYNLNGNFFRMDGDKRFGGFLNFNNVNAQGFGGGGGGGGGNSNNGLNKTFTAGVRYGNQISKKTELNGSYSYNNQHSVQNSKSFNQTLYGGDSSRLSSNNRYGINDNQSHGVDLNIETKFDSSNELRIRPNFTYSKSSGNSESSSEISRLKDGDTTRLSSTDARNTNNANSYNAGLGTTYRHAFGKKGRSISLDLQLSANRNESDGTNYSDIYNYERAKDSVTNQIFSSVNESQSISTTLSYTEPLAPHQLLELEVNGSYRKTNSDRKTYNYDSTTGSYTDLNGFLTNQYENSYQSTRATLGYMYSDEFLNVSAGTGVQFGRLSSDNLSKDLHLSKDYVNLYPTASMSYKFSKTRRLRFNYRGRTNQPTVTQLQPVVDNSNQLHITSGNPDLKQEFNNSFLLRYNNFNRENNKSFDVTISADVTQNKISNAKFLLPNGGDSTKPVNLNGFYNISGYLNWSLPLNRPKSNLNLSTRVSNQRSASLVDNKINNTFTTTLSQRIGWSTNLAELFDVDFSTNPTYNLASYSVNKNQDGNYYSQSFSFDGTFYSKSGWEVMSDFNYTFYAGLPKGQNTAIPIWNAGIAKLFWDNAGELKLSVNDILNQNKGIDFTRTDNVIGWTQNSVLKRYFMLTFTYNLRKFGGKKMRRGPEGRSIRMMNFDGGRRGGGFGGGRGGGGGRGRGGF